MPKRVSSLVFHVCTEAFCFPKVLRTPISWEILPKISQHSSQKFPKIRRACGAPRWRDSPKSPKIRRACGAFYSYGTFVENTLGQNIFKHTWHIDPKVLRTSSYTVRNLFMFFVFSWYLRMIAVLGKVLRTFPKISQWEIPIQRRFQKLLKKKKH